MENQNINQLFRDDEITLIKRWDKDRNEYIANPYPKIGGRLRLAHEDNEALSIETEIIKYDEQVAVVSAIVTSVRGCFKGIGMASIQRDEKIAPAILELAETRAIARALRFAGYGVEYCSAEEMSHLANSNGNDGNGDNPKSQHRDSLPNGANRNGGNNYNRPHLSNRNGHDGNGSRSSRDTGNGNGNGNERLTNKQYNYMLQLNEEQGRTKSDLDQQCLNMFGTMSEYLSKGDASTVIEQLLSK